MTQLLDDRNIHLANFTLFARHAPPTLPWLQKLRRSAIARFDLVGFPGAKDEEWRFTNTAPIAQTPFVLAEHDDPAAAASLAADFTFANQAAAEIVFVNGRFSPQLSRLSSLPAGITVTSLATALQNTPALLEQHLARYARIETDPFVALNTGFIRDGAFVHLARNAVVRHPIHLLFLSIPSAEPAIAHPRVLVVAEDNSQATIVESYAGKKETGPFSNTFFNNAVTEIVAADNVHLDHCKLEQESPDAFHIAHMHVTLGRECSFVSHAASIGGKLVRNDLVVLLNGQHTDATVNGLVVLRDSQHVDNHTILRHEKPHCSSHELYKHVLDNRSTCVFKGKIFVQKDAQKTDSKQTSKSLLLSDEATMNAMPALEIYADDVKCTHGSTTGPVDEDMIFYLRSRGVPREAARHLLTYAFAADITRRIKVEPVRRRLEDFMAAQHGLPQDLRITDLGSHDQAAL